MFFLKIFSLLFFVGYSFVPKSFAFKEDIENQVSKDADSDLHNSVDSSKNTSKVDQIFIMNSDLISENDDVIELSGNVQIKSSENFLTADKILYSKKNKILKAIGKVYLKDESGNLYFSDEMEINHSLKKGIVKNLQIKLTDRSRISAKKTDLNLNKSSKAEKVIFSSCENCKYDPSRPLVWEIKADEVEYDHDNEVINYKNAFMEILGVPVIFFPRFSHPSPKLERKTGFLMPHFMFSKKLGFVAIPSYIFALSRSSEFILKAAFASKKDRIFFGEYNRKLWNGDIHIAGSLTDYVDPAEQIGRDLSKNEKREVERILDNGFRGHIDATAVVFDKTKSFKLFTNIKRQSDKSYLDRYAFLPNEKSSSIDFDTSYYESNLGFELFNDNKNYAIVKFATFQSTLIDDDDTIPFIAPYFNIDINKDFNGIPGNFFLNVNFLNCDFKNEDKDRKLFIKSGYKDSKIFNNGILFSYELSLVGHFINVKDKLDGFSTEQINNISPRVSTRLIMPLLVEYENQDFKGIFSPKIFFTSGLRANKKFKSYLDRSNVFIKYYEISHSNILYDDLVSEINNFYNTSKFVYGMDYQLFYRGEKKFDCFLGQGIFFKNINYNIETGISKSKFSDYIFDSSFYLFSDLQFRFTGLISSKTGKSLRKNISLDYQNDVLNFSIGSSTGIMNNLYDNKKSYKAFYSDIAFRFKRYYEAFWGYKLGDKKYKPLSNNFGFRYQDECFSYELRFEKTYYRKIDCENDTKIVLTINFKNLGGIKINQSIKKLPNSNNVNDGF